ncbi:MAG: hypothetical protein WAQ22_00560, partial [Candidatus Saccharimonas sp.]
NAARLTMAENTIKLLELYKATYGEYPKLEADRGYCVGTGYPNGKCRDSYNDGPTGYPETRTDLSNELKKVGTIPSGGYSMVVSTVGPYVTGLNSGNALSLSQVFDKSTMDKCPSMFTGTWIAPNDNRIICSKSFYYN